VKLREWGALKFPSSSLPPPTGNDEEALVPSSARKRRSACLEQDQEQSASPSSLPLKSPRWDKEHFRVAQSPEGIGQDPPMCEAHNTPETESSPPPSSIDVLPHHEKFETAYAAYALVELKRQPAGRPRRCPPPISFPVAAPSFTSDAWIARDQRHVNPLHISLLSTR
jgi:hypothetical protein